MNEQLQVKPNNGHNAFISCSRSDNMNAGKKICLK